VIGILGGSFDPVHNGHLQCAKLLLQTYAFTEIRFIPCRKSVLHKINHATAEQRYTMLQLAIKTMPNCTVDNRELMRPTVSYTFDTLLELRAHYSEPMALILGTDAFAHFDQWYRWQELIHSAHLFILIRPDHPVQLNQTLEQYVHNYQVHEPSELYNRSSGLLTMVQSQELLAISSSKIRQQIREKIAPTDLPESVWHYIQQERLYIDCDRGDEP